MGVDRIFIHGTDKVEGALMVLFFGLVFSVAPPLEIFLPTPLIRIVEKSIGKVRNRRFLS